MGEYSPCSTSILNRRDGGLPHAEAVVVGEEVDVAFVEEDGVVVVANRLLMDVLKMVELVEGDHPMG